jgi:uncharacterized phage-associated protein
VWRNVTPVADSTNTEKYLEVLQFLLASGANNCHLGKVKLMKLLYFADFDHYYRYGSSITGDAYVKLEYGPVPRCGQAMIDELHRRGQLDVDREPVYEYFRNVYRLKREPAPMDHLDPNEVSTLADIVNKWSNHTREDIVAASHGDPPWIMVDYGDEIPYDLVFYRNNLVGDQDEEPEIVSQDVA